MVNKKWDKTCYKTLAVLTSLFYRIRKQMPPAFLDPQNQGTLTPRHIVILNELLFGQEIGVTELAEQAHMNLPVTSRLVSELAEMKLVVRSEDPDDHRRTVVRLAKEQQKAYESYANYRARPLLRTLEKLKASEREIFMRGLQILSDEMLLVLDDPKNS